MPTGACYNRRHVAPKGSDERDRVGGIGGFSHAPLAGAARAGDGGSAFRAHARRGTRLQALVAHVGTGWQRQVAIENIGLGGACLALDDRLAAGDSVNVSFTAPTLWDPLVLRARVVWVSPEAAPPRSDPVAAGHPTTAGPAGVEHRSCAYRAGVAFEHGDAHGVFALYELIAALGYE